MSTSLRTLKGVGEKTEKLFCGNFRDGCYGGICESGEKSSGDYNYGGGSYREAFGYLV